MGREMKNDFVIFRSKFKIDSVDISDIRTKWNIEEILINKNDIINHFANDSLHIGTIIEFVDYLILETISKYEGKIPRLIKEEDINDLNSIINFAKETLEKYINSNNEIYDLINNQFEKIFLNKTDKYDYRFLIKKCVELSYKQFSRINPNVFRMIEKNNWNFIISNFEDYKNYYEKNLNDLDNLLIYIYQFEEKHPYSNIDLFLVKYQNIKFDGVMKKIAILLSDKAIRFIKEVNLDNYLEVFSFYEDIYKVAIKYQLSKQLNEFRLLKSNLENVGKEYFDTKGQVFTQKIDLKIVVAKLKEDLIQNKEATNFIFLQLTHEKSIKELKYTPLINNVFKIESSKFGNFGRHLGVNSNNKFTPDVQSNLKMSFDLYDHILFLITNDKDLSEPFFEVLLKVLGLICDEYSLDFNDLKDELDGIIDSIVYLYAINKEYPYYRTFCYGLSQNICAYIEKLLRKVFIETYDKDIIYYDESLISLSDLLKAEEIQNILGNDLIDIINFELQQINETQYGVYKPVGNNFRNRLMHNRDIVFMKEINIGLVIHLFNILIIIIHQLEASVIKIIN